jgi:hypothetical protein
MSSGPDSQNSRELPNISNALELEQLDPILFRSTSLYLPKGSRGVFGGHVISQALVAATKCVSKEYALHVSKCKFPILLTSLEILSFSSRYMWVQISRISKVTPDDILH